MNKVFASIIFVFGVFSQLFSEELGTTSVRVELANGDVVSGVLIEETPEAIRIRSTYAGIIEIKRSAVLGLSYPTEKKELKPKVVVKVAEAPEKVIVKAEGGPEEVIAVEEPIWLSQIADSFRFKDWKKSLEVGVTSQTGRKESSDYSFRYSMSRKKKKDQFKFSGNYYYSETDLKTTTDKNNASFRWRHDFAPGVFYQTDSAYSFDQIKKIDYDLEQKLGLGYRLIERDRTKLSTGMGATARKRKSLDGVVESGMLVNAFQDWEHQLHKKVSINQDLKVATQTQDADLYEIDFRAGISSEITETLNFTLRFELEYDNSLKEELKRDQRLIGLIGYDF